MYNRGAYNEPAYNTLPVPAVPVVWPSGLQRTALAHEDLFDGEVGEVVGITNTVNADGRGSIIYGGSEFFFRVLKATIGETDYPLPFENDPYTTVSLLGRLDGDGNAVYALMFDDLPAPSWGRDIGGSFNTWQPATEFADIDSVIFRMAWVPGSVTLSEGGVLKANTWVDLAMIYDTEQDSHLCWWEAVYPWDGYGAARGMFRTNADGVVESVYPNGTTEPIMVPRGFGAQGYRGEDEDGWPSAPTPERTLSSLRMYYKQEFVEIEEGVDSELDIAAVSITINGPADAKYSIMWYGGLLRKQGTLDGAGTATENTNLPPGKYHVALYHPNDDTQGGIPRQSIETVSGGQYTVTFAGAWTDYSAPTYKIQGIAYHYGSEPLAGATIYGWKTELGNTGWVALATTGADGSFEATTNHEPSIGFIAILDSQGSCMVQPATALDLSGFWWDVGVAGSFAACNSGAAPPTGAEGLRPWGADGPHEHLPVTERAAYVEDEGTGEQFDFRETPNGVGVWTDPLPRWVGSSSLTQGENDAVALKLYSVHDASGEEIQAPLSLVADDNAPWVTGDPNFEGSFGRTVYAYVGGKAHGSAVESNFGELITATEGPKEAFRLGLQSGEWLQPLEHRTVSVGLEDKLINRALTFESWVCSTCGGPVWVDPTHGGYTRGHCIEGTDNGYHTEMISSFRTRTLSVLQVWRNRVVKTMTSGLTFDVEVSGWPAPVAYEETDAYLVANWLGLGLSRWVATHLTLGQWTLGGFADGESIAGAEGTLGRTVGPVMLKIIGTSDGGGSVTVTATDTTGVSVVLTTTMPVGWQTALPLFLDQWAHHNYPRGYYIDVTAATNGDAEFSIVNDGPGWRSTSGIEIERGKSSPWACDVDFGSDDVDSVLDAAGIAWITYTRERTIYVRSVPNPRLEWTDEERVDDLSGFAYPRIRAMSDGGLQMTALDVRANETVHWQSDERGTRWERIV
jgi:hypothetical protein